jgi:hypothetical protein
MCGPCSVFGIATGYGLGGPGIESQWRREFPHLSKPALGPTQPPIRWVPGKERPGRDADSSLRSSAVGHVRVELPLLSLWAVWPVQNLSACTKVHFTLPFSYQYM